MHRNNFNGDKTNFLLLLIITLHLHLPRLLIIFPLLTATVSADDATAMAILAAALKPRPPNWSPVNSSSYCEWPRVSCKGTGTVLSIDLDSMNLTGSLPSWFPPLLGLAALSFSNNNLSGPMPRLHNLISLQTLSLEVNSFTSVTMEFFEGLSTTLENFSISFNPFLATWSIPTQLSRLVNLKEFNAVGTNIVGPLPDIFQSFPLNKMQLSNNSLAGPLPPSMEKSGLSYLVLDHTGLSGSIEVLSKIPFLKYAILGNNKFTGPIPDFSNCKALKFLFLQNNELTGVVPKSLVSLSSVSSIDFSNNRLQGPFPTFLLQKPVNLDDNNFCTDSGNSCDPQVTTLLRLAADLVYPLKLSEAWSGNDACNRWSFVRCNSQKEVVEIDFRNLHFNGTISSAFADLKALQYLYLNDNNLTGSIPDSLAGLQDLRVLDVSNNDLSGEIPPFRPYVKLNITGNPALNSKSPSKAAGKQRMKLIIGIVVAVMSTIMSAIFVFHVRRMIAKHMEKGKSDAMEKGESYSKFFDLFEKKENQIIVPEIQTISFQKLAAATDNFDLKNKIGEGGFGPVYKGQLQDGQDIAVKRLSTASGQGLEEFVNEVMVISKVQHKNLVKLLGFCITEREKMLVYEYMPNMSLDAYLFDPEKRKILDWRKRIKIIEGICWGLLYLHRDSRPRIIHRDLKTSNILLDEDWNPKISDFGMARIFGANEDQANTKRVVGTFGYMPREYAMEGRFSEKSDIFSFGVLVLEIISGRRNTSFYDDEDCLNLLEYAWKLWNRGEVLGLIDPMISDPCFQEEIFKCTHVGLLCVQDFVKDRPTISLVISMLRSETENLPTPKQPSFLEQETISEQRKNRNCSVNNVTITDVEPR